eukprot:comp17831_c0_seq1/m.17974 comp17831_c0_seq1/g.17974  ORF comp17831_c0_seq1/g.17974 comp17831_c0_seq1/m.17974 type:complete len:594 (-) comp17831_c0_seq1:231-2012(-)
MGKQDDLQASVDHFAQYRKDHPEWYYTVPDNETFLQRVFVRPYQNTVFYFRRVQDQFGWRFMVLLNSAYFGIKGFLYILLYTAMLPFFLKFLKATATDYQIYGTVSTTPFSMKALIGMISDVMPIRGYHKKWYIAMSAIFGMVCYAILGFTNMTADLAPLAAVMFFLCNLQIALVDLLIEGRYAQLMVRNPETSSDIVTWVWANYFIGGLLATWTVGPLGDAYESTNNSWYLKGMFLASAPLAGQVIVPILLGWLGEEPLPRPQWGFQSTKWRRHRGVYIMAIVTGLSALGLAVLSLINSKLIAKHLPTEHRQLPILVYALTTAAILLTIGFFVLPRGVAKAMTFFFVSASLYVNISGVLDTFYTATAGCVPDGPQFDQMYYITWSGTVSSVFGVLGGAIFRALMSDWPFRRCFWASWALQASAGLIDIIMTERWNVRAGIPDKVMFMLGYNIIFQIIAMLNLMPGVVLMSKLCPKGMESTLYAMLAGFNNFGANVSRSIGVYMIQALGVSMSNDGPCEYSKLPLLIVVCHIILPALSVPLTFILIPEARLTDPVMKDELHDAFAQHEDDVVAADSEVQLEGHVQGDGKKAMA